MYPTRLQDFPPEIRNRAAIERRIVRSLVNEFARQGFIFSVDDGQEYIPCRNSKQALAALMNTDEDHLGVIRGGTMLGWIHLVYGNDGWDVIADYHVGLEIYMPKTLALADQLSA